MLKLIIIIPVFAILTYQIIVVTNRYLMLFEYKRLHGVIVKAFEDARNFNSTCLILQEECNELQSYLQLIEQTITNPSGNREMEKGLNDIKLLFEEAKEKIQDKKDKWRLFTEFKDGVEFTKINLRSKGDELKLKAQKLIKEEKKHKKEIEEKLNHALQILENVIKEYETLDRSSFAEFNFYILDDVEGEYINALQQAELTMEELRLFDKGVKIYLNSLTRKSTYYITLEETVEGRRGKNRIGEIVVSYKTFKSYEVGKKYKKDVIVSNKRTVSSQFCGILVSLEDRQYSVMKEFDKEEFAAIYKELPISKNQLETDEFGLPWDIKLADLQILICEKGSKEFAIKYYVTYFTDKFYSLLQEGEKGSLAPP